MEEDFRADGKNGSLVLIGNRIRIERKGMLSLMTQGLKGDKEILIKTISAIQMKKIGLMTNGYIQFSFFGGKETLSGLFGATRDENSIMFNKAQQPAFIKIKGMIEERMDSMNGR